MSESSEVTECWDYLGTGLEVAADADQGRGSNRIESCAWCALESRRLFDVVVVVVVVVVVGVGGMKTWCCRWLDTERGRDALACCAVVSSA